MELYQKITKSYPNLEDGHYAVFTPGKIPIQEFGGEGVYSKGAYFWDLMVSIQSLQYNHSYVSFNLITAI